MLNWLSISTHPDLTTAHSLLAITNAALTQGHLNAIQYVGCYIKATADYRISFSSRSNNNLENFFTFPLPGHYSSSPIPAAFTDANWGPQDASIPLLKNIQPVSITKTTSILGHIIFLSGGSLIWKCNKETDECAKNVQWMRNLLVNLDLLPPLLTPIYNDNQAAIIWCNTSSTKGMHHYNIHENAVQEEINEHKEVSVY